MEQNFALNDVINALKTDTQFQALPTQDQQDWLQELPHILEALDELLECNVTMHLWLQARWLIAETLSQTVSKARRRVHRQRIIDQANRFDLFGRNIALMPDVEEYVICGPLIGLNDTAKTLYLAGELTFARLLTTDPAALIINKNAHITCKIAA